MMTWEESCCCLLLSLCSVLGILTSPQFQNLGETPLKAELARTWGSDIVPDADLGRNISLKSLDL